MGAGGAEESGRVVVCGAASPDVDGQRAADALHRSSRPLEPGGGLRRGAQDGAGAHHHRSKRADAAAGEREATRHGAQNLSFDLRATMKRAVTLAVLGAAVLMPHSVLAQAQFNVAPPTADLVEYVGPEPIRVLWIAAHPDDEDTNLIAWLARGRNVETAYMSLSRGDGGQNLIGNELGEALGVIRTEELLAARRIDGAHQYFGRAYDFGFSKTADETRKHWPQDSLLRDVITVMRAFRPQIVITTFSGTPRDGHGQHQISAIVARDAYKLAADTVQFPAGEFGAQWTPLKFYRLARFSPQDRTLSSNVGEYNPDLGLSYQEIAADSRSQHK